MPSNKLFFSNLNLFGPASLRNNKKYDFSEIDSSTLRILGMLEESLDPELFNDFLLSYPSVKEKSEVLTGVGNSKNKNILPTFFQYPKKSN